MGSALSKLFTVLLAVVLLFYYPLMGMFETQERTRYAYLLSETTLFVDTICNVGVLTPALYEQFLNELSAADVLWDIDLEHRHRTYVPVYTDPSDPSTFQNTYALHYDAYFTKHIRDALYPAGVPALSGYAMSADDYFVVTVSNKHATIGTRVKELLLGHVLPEKSLVVRYGGMVK